jgi:hypothetical protein
MVEELMITIDDLMCYGTYACAFVFIYHTIHILILNFPGSIFPFFFVLPWSASMDKRVSIASSFSE